MQNVTFRPVPASNRPETAPLLPIEIEVSDLGTIVRYADAPDVFYDQITQACADHQMSATELLGADLTDDAIEALRREALEHGDNVTAGHCEAALDGESYGREKVADAIVMARLMGAE